MRNHLARRWKTLAVAVVASLLVTLAGHTPASAVTVGCGSACDYQDPDDYVANVGGVHRTCAADAVTKLTAQGVELRYSAFCRTAWARATYCGYLGFVNLYSYDSTGTWRAFTSSYRTGNCYSPMLNDKGMTAKACSEGWLDEVDYENNPPREFACTGRY